MRALTDNQRELLIAALELARGTWDNDSENAQLDPLFDHLVHARARDDVSFLGAWSAEYGHCHECNLPAAFAVPDAYGAGQQLADHHLRCAVCAANAAAEGERVIRLEEVMTPQPSAQ